MTPLEAKKALSLHSGRDGDTDDPKWQCGFLGSLRPYRGELIERNFHEVIECLKVLSPELRSGALIDREVTSDIVGIVHLARCWALEPDGMLRRNKLITERDQAKLENWIRIIEYSFMMTIDSDDPEEAFAEYRDYCDSTETE